MAITGLLMFFHLDSGLNKTAHEWLGWLMVVAGVAAHAFANWLAFKRYFLSSKLGRGILAASVLVIGLSFVPLQLGGAGGASPTGLGHPGAEPPPRPPRPPPPARPAGPGGATHRPAIGGAAPGPTWLPPAS
ncbi:MAG: hypothetical protein IPP87_20220 [Ideonella sp.]|nr:hypothetical protein [Ideonella sp.]